ncbi:MAG: MgtC/SapB family protein [Peptococcia bacterium]|jgi:putative Mg2+ transporter-C (MgtC) family protein
MEYELIITLRLFLAALLGGLIGLERESLNKSAGLRTHILVCLGSCLIMITSVEIFETVGHGQIGDPARIAAQVVSGIGFLGAGTILRSGFGVKGLTTAASLWLVAAIGLAVGIGSYAAAIICTAIVFIILVYMPRLEKRVKSAERNKKLEIVMLDKPGQIGLITTLLGDLNVDIRNINMAEKDDHNCKLTFLIVLPYCLEEAELIEKINTIEGVSQISFS